MPPHPDPLSTPGAPPAAAASKAPVGHYQHGKSTPGRPAPARPAADARDRGTAAKGRAARGRAVVIAVLRVAAAERAAGDGSDDVLKFRARGGEGGLNGH